MDYLFNILKKVVARRVEGGEVLEDILLEYPNLTAEQEQEIKGGKC